MATKPIIKIDVAMASSMSVKPVLWHCRAPTEPGQRLYVKPFTFFPTFPPARFPGCASLRTGGARIWRFPPGNALPLTQTPPGTGSFPSDPRSFGAVGILFPGKDRSRRCHGVRSVYILTRSPHEDLSHLARISPPRADGGRTVHRRPGGGVRPWRPRGGGLCVPERRAAARLLPAA